ncbi:homeobox-containing protein 1-like isoform X2 [Amphiura filiformis]|uniref:homeobox-containing protein 1-like isoform X2 n=1 Tax=Amphiura filiformis TaxID=82378 RepID=UPI003B22797C
MATQNEPRYTIEQIELLRRLIRTGLTKQDIIHALDTMTKLDTELGPASSLHQSQTPVQPIQSSQQTGLVPMQPIQASQQTGLVQRSPVHFFVPSTQTPQITVVTSPSSATPAVNQLMNAVHQATGNRHMIQPSLVRLSSAVSSTGSEDEEVKCGFENFDVADEEVNELFRRGTVIVKEEIKDFLSKHKITQNQISHATGISQSYISQFLIHGSIMRQSTQALFYRWYLGKMKEMDIIEKESGGSIEASKKVYPGKNAHLIPPIRRRERFSWNEACLKVLETYWKKNPYPNDVEREKITEACNTAQQVAGEVLVDSRLVTTAKVYNWFANRRKDANRRKRSGLGENDGTETAVVTFTCTPADPDETSQSNMLHIASDLNQGTSDNDDASFHQTSQSMTRLEHHQPPRQQAVALELETVNNSIITLIEAVEEKNQEEKS